MNKNYINRIIEKNIDECLNSVGAINITGPKFCGKNFISEFFAKSSCYMQEQNEKNKEILQFNPSAHCIQCQKSIKSMYKIQKKKQII